MPKQELARIRDLTWKRAQEFFAEKRNTHVGMGDFIVRFLDELEDSLKGGKAVRGALVCYGGICAGKPMTPAMIDLALAMEMFHTFLLIHDDIIDRDDVRRGKPSFHAKYALFESEEYSPSDAKHFGASMAIIGADLLCTFGYELILQADLPMETKLKILRLVTTTIFETGVGEILDVLNDIREQPSREHLMKVHTLKTSRYTFYSPLMIGAYAAGATEEQMRVLEAYAMPMGIAFQLHDDLLGMFGEEEKLGKPVYSDLREGKQTLLIIEAYRRIDAAAKRVIDRALGNQEVTKKQAEEVKMIIMQSGAYEYSINLAHEFKDRALRALETNVLDLKGQDFLTCVAEYIVNREY